MMPMVDQTGSFEPAMKAMSDEELRAKTLEFRARIAARLDGIDDAEERVAQAHYAAPCNCDSSRSSAARRCSSGG